jgi:hypothetical protein
VPHWPLELHDCTPLPEEHCVCPGAHTPVHVPEMQVWLEQGCGMPHMPPTQDCAPLPEHCFWPAEQAPVQAPPEHFSAFGHGVSVHCPLLVHVCTPVPALSHSTAFGWHTPQWPAEQTEASHGTAAPQLPAELHVSTPPPFGAHWVAPAAHVPVQTASPASSTSHTWLEHAEPALLQVPDWAQYCGSGPEHRDVPGVQPASPVVPSCGARESSPPLPSPVVVSSDEASSSGFPSSMPRMAPQPE